MSSSSETNPMELLHRAGELLARLRGYVMPFRAREIASLGRNVHLQKGCRIFGRDRISIGDDVYIGPDAWIDAQGGVMIGPGTIIGPRLKIYSASHHFRNARMLPYDERIEYRPVSIGANCWIGGDVLIVPGANIGEGCIVGAGAVVAGTHPACAIIAGNPARQVGERDRAHYDELKRDGKVYLRSWPYRPNFEI